MAEYTVWVHLHLLRETGFFLLPFPVFKTCDAQNWLVRSCSLEVRLRKRSFKGFNEKLRLSFENKLLLFMSFLRVTGRAWFEGSDGGPCTGL